MAGQQEVKNILLSVKKKYSFIHEFISIPFTAKTGSVQEIFADRE